MLSGLQDRLQERCAELQREIFRIQGAHNHNQSSYKNIEKRPVALPRHVPPDSNKLGSSEHDDEGISSSETGQSLSPEPHMYNSINNQQTLRLNALNHPNDDFDDDTNDATIEDVIDELQNIVNDAEREIFSESPAVEEKIVPAHILPQPPKKSRSLAHLLSSSSDFDGSDYGLLLIPNGSRRSFFDDREFENDSKLNGGFRDSFQYKSTPDIVNNRGSTNREILNVVMDAREMSNGMGPILPHMSNPMRKSECDLKNATAPTPPFSGVYFMTEMNTPQKYPKPDITAALEARRVTKNLDWLESYGSGIDSMIDIVMPGQIKKDSIIRFGHSDGNILDQIDHGSLNTSAKLTDLPSGLY